ncbi:MAG: response regulator [Coleofasciculaceae cyanobacterium]
MVNSDRLLKLNPISLLREAASNNNGRYLQVTSGLVSWRFHLNNSKLTYASYTIPSHPLHSLTRLKHHLKCLGYKEAAAALEKNIQGALAFQSKGNNSLQYNEHQAILWLLNQQHLASWQAKELIEVLVKEVFEFFLSVREGTYQLKLHTPKIPVFSEFELQSLIEFSQKRLQFWQSLGPAICSPYQRPYISNQDFLYRDNQRDRILPTVKQQLSTLLKGNSIRHLAYLLKQDELKIAEFLHPYIANGSISLRKPEPPFDQLPQLYQPVVNIPSPPTVQHKSCPLIACVDDSPNTLNEIERLLGKENFSFFKCLEPIKAAIVLRRIKPDLILLDVGMPTMNGYELCRMLRNHPSFQKTPIVMVTGNKGTLSKAKAKKVGASAYLTKPFTQSDLQEIVARYLA